MKQKMSAGLIGLLSLTAISGTANALAVPVPEPNIISLLGLGGVVAILVVRYFRR